MYVHKTSKIHHVQFIHTPIAQIRRELSGKTRNVKNALVETTVIYKKHSTPIFFILLTNTSRYPCIEKLEQMIALYVSYFVSFLAYDALENVTVTLVNAYALQQHYF